MSQIPWHRDMGTGQLRGDGEDPALFVDPATLIQNGAQPETILAFVQEAAAQVLDEVVNRWPACRLAGRAWHERLARRVDASARIARALQDRGLCGSDPLTRRAQAPAEQALACIQLAREAASRLDVPLNEVVVEPRGHQLDELALSHGSAGLQTRLKRLALRTGGLVEGLYVHGSVALGDTTGFSDLDGMILLSADAQRDPDALARAARGFAPSARLLLNRDALQHHGWLVAAPFLLEAFPESMLPLESIAEGAVIFGSDRLTVRPLRCRMTARRKLWGMVQVFRALRHGGARKRAHSLHGDKMLLSQFMLLPSLYLQATDHYVSKRRSFSLVRAELPGLPWDIMDASSALRADWTQPRFGKLWMEVARGLGPWEAQALWRRFSLSHRRESGVPRVPDAWIDRMAEFAESLLAAAESAGQESGAR